ncbi:MAG: creatininase family protein [Planctomycetota bacterium]|nr:creatininase family protein [Planctomycetota bacterium]MDA1141736.1 creatininase family protein [Planctomycetota bacterium]
MNNTLSDQVQMQLMRPQQVEAAGRDFPVVYVPFGCVEWHGLHLPLGVDSLKAHGILVKCAEEFGGVVYPPVYFHNGFPNEHLFPVITHLFKRLKESGFRVIIGVSGHNVPEQIDMINQALEPVVADGTATGIGLWEMSLSRGEESSSDHAAKWETSNMMFFYDHLVDISALGDGPINLDMKPPHGIGGLDPRKHASTAVGERNVELCVESIGRKAQELLASLSEEHRAFGKEDLRPGNWWMV